MRHLKAHRKLNRTSSHRKAMLRNMATSLINADNEYIVTTVQKAKELRPFVEKAITLARKAQKLDGDEGRAKEVHLRRKAATYFYSGNRGFKQEQSRYTGGSKVEIERTAGVKALRRLFDELGERYKDRNGGYTRIVRIGGRRKGDNAEMAVIELVDSPREKAASA